MFKTLIISCILLVGLVTPAQSQKMELFPVICSTTNEMYKHFIEKNFMKPIIMSHDQEHDLLYIIFANSKRQVVVTISSIKENKSCVLSIFENATGLFDFNQIKGGDKI